MGEKFRLRVPGTVARVVAPLRPPQGVRVWSTGCSCSLVISIARNHKRGGTKEDKTSLTGIWIERKMVWNFQKYQKMQKWKKKKKRWWKKCFWWKNFFKFFSQIWTQKRSDKLILAERVSTKTVIRSLFPTSLRDNHSFWQRVGCEKVLWLKKVRHTKWWFQPRIAKMFKFDRCLGKGHFCFSWRHFVFENFSFFLVVCFYFHFDSILNLFESEL